MIPTLTVHDGVLEDLDSLRADLLTREFVPFNGVDGGLYEHTSTEPSFEAILGPKIEAILGKKPVFKLAGWRLDLEGEASVNHCHADSVYSAEWACVYYTNPPEQEFGGTAFWRHKATGLDRLPTDAALTAAGFNLQRWHSDMTQQTLNPDKWELSGCVGMRYNRLIIYPTRAWHSRMPAQGFGTDLQTGRLVGVGFFDV